MKRIILKIPTEFEKDFNENRFQDCLQRLIADTKERFEIDNILSAGIYEIEICNMLIKAFNEAEILHPVITRNDYKNFLLKSN